MTREARRWFLPLVAIGLLQVGFVLLYKSVSARKRTSSRSQPLRVGEVAPPLAAVRGDGSPSTFAQIGGGPVLVHFWATWCEPCRKELPSLLAFGKLTDGVPVIAVSVDDDWDSIRGFFEGGVPENVVRAASAAHAAYGGSMLPDSYLLDGERRLVARFEGARDWDAPTFRAQLGRLVHGK